MKKVTKEVKEEAKETAQDEVQGAACERVSGPNSFVPGTKVLMADGSTKSIEKVKAGDKVIATDPKTGKTSVQTAAATIKGKGSKKLVRITLRIHGGPSGKAQVTTVTATAGHPFWVPSLREWVDAGELKRGQWVQTLSGTWLQIGAVEAWTAKATVHNLTVTDVHTYYVVVGATPVLVHNCGERTPAEAGMAPHDAQRIQNAADRLGYPIIVVGSRARGRRTAENPKGFGPESDWDFILDGPSRQRGKVKNSLPRGIGDGEGSGRGRDFWQSYNPNAGRRADKYGELDPSLPHVIFRPRRR
ncbi:HINT domain-containing protein [Streptomyces sp. A012304]|uniref:HINT domain-containing protein n=1 Tax=Streptomyces sp. A012304 TaxID=375446 RepID=UPI0022313E9E|nr:HINT domain-containing protein [Streptomyces sp. A012304]GKQ41208.1 hypothetical protein ALMP_77250 [Streptomyces sp. A012304]